MNKYFSIILSVCLLLSIGGCSIFSSKGKATKAEAQSRNKISNIEDKMASNVEKKIETVAALAFGTDYALGKVNDPPKEVTVAKDINQRVISIAGSPAIDKMKEMQATIDKLLSTLASERVDGKRRLESKDNEISAIQEESKILVQAKDAEIHKYMKVAQEAAAAADEYKSQLSEYTKWFGLGGVLKGLWQFITSMAWILGIGFVLFLILRIASMSNPIAASIFSIFNMAGSWIVHIIQVILPKAVELAGNVSKELYDSTSKLLSKIVDSIEWIKQIEKETGQPVTLKQLFDQLDKTMDQKEKSVIDNIRTKLGY